MNHARCGHTAVRLRDGSVLVVGDKTAEMWSPKTKRWSKLPDTQSTRWRPVVVEHPDGRIVVLGGERGVDRARVEVFDPAVKTWTSLGSIPAGIRSSSAALLRDGRLLIAGHLHPLLITLR